MDKIRKLGSELPLLQTIKKDSREMMNKLNLRLSNKNLELSDRNLEISSPTDFKHNVNQVRFVLKYKFNR